MPNLVDFTKYGADYPVGMPKNQLKQAFGGEKFNAEISRRKYVLSATIWLNWFFPLQ